MGNFVNVQEKGKLQGKLNMNIYVIIQISVFPISWWQPIITIVAQSCVNLSMTSF